MPDGPLEDPIAEAGRIAEAAQKAGVKVKLLGGAGIHLHSPSATRPPLKRKYGDLDYAISKKHRKGVLALFPSLGYEANDRFNLMNGDSRLYFYDNGHSRQVDIFIDVFKMSHAIDARYVARLACEDWGLCRTVQLNIPKLLQTLDELDVDRDLVRSRVAEIKGAIDAGPKPLKWKLRAQVGDRLQWYELPEEVRSPYQPE